MPPESERRRLIVIAIGSVMSLLFVAVGALGVGILSAVHEARVHAQVQGDVSHFRSEALAQVRRDLLRLDSALVSGSSQELQRDLLIGRVESSVALVDRQLGTVELREPLLVGKAQQLAERWRTEVRPSVAAAESSPTDADAQRVAHRNVLQLESSYENLLGLTERLRSIRAAEELTRSQQLLETVQISAAGMIVTDVLLLSFVVIAVIMYLGLERTRVADRQQLAALDARLRLMSKVAELTQNPVMITDGRGRLEWFNESFERLTGWTLAEAVGLTPGSLVQGPGTDPVVRRRMHDAVAMGQGFLEEVTNHHRDGTEFRIRLDVQPIRDGDSGPSHYVAVGTDVTQLYQTETHWRQAKQAADDAARDKSTFLAVFSHEMLTPLTTVSGALMLIEDSLTSTDDARHLAMAVESTEEIRRHVTNLLTFSALESGRWDSTTGPTDVRGVLQKCLDRLGPKLRLNQVQVELEIQDDVPALVLSEEGHLEQLILNLIHNAVTASSGGTVSVRVAVETLGAARTLEVAVGDSGPELDPADRARMEALFLNVRDSLWRREDGTGLGLATCALIVRQLGGTVSVVSRAGQGAQFRVRLPLVGQASVALPVVPSPAVIESACHEAAPMQVLLVEDHPVNARIAKALLLGMGAQVQVAGDGNQALDLVDGPQSFDLVLMDINLPGIDGMEITREIRRRGGDIRQPFILAHTANVLPGDGERFLASGMDGVLPKPLERASLERALSRGRSARAAIPAQRSRGQAPDDDRQPAKQSTEPASSREAAAALAAEIGEEAARELWQAFGEELDGRLVALDDAALKGDLDDVRVIAHTLAGSAASLRISGLAAACGRVESSARAERLDQVRTDLIDVHAQAQVTWPVGGDADSGVREDDKHQGRPLATHVAHGAEAEGSE